MLKRVAQVVVFIGLLSSDASGEESLCAALRPLAKDVDDHRMRETDLTRARFDEALTYFKEDLARQLAEAKSIEEVTNKGSFWIAYDNGLKVLEGYALRQAALLERSRRVGVKGRGPATQGFREFLAKTRYPD